MDIINASFSDGFFEDNYIWVFDNRIQAICRVHIETLEMEIISHYMNIDKFIAYDIYFFQNKFYLMTKMSSKILVYDRDCGTFNLLIPSWKEEKTLSNCAIYTEKCYIYFFPYDLNKNVVCVDLCNQVYIQKKLPVSLIRKELGNSDLPVNFFSFCSGIVWFVLLNTNCYGKYNMIEEMLVLFNIEAAGGFLDRICCDGEHIWLTESENGNITCLEKGVVTISENLSYSQLSNIDGSIIALPTYSDKVVLVDKKNFRASVICLPFSEAERQRKEGFKNIVKCREYRDFIYLFPHGIKDLFLLDKKTLEVKRVKITCKDYIKKCFENKNIYLKEDKNIDLQVFQRFCGRKNEMSNHTEMGKMSQGSSIWDSIKRFV